MRKRAEIRRRVKRHIARRGEQNDFQLTEAFCMYWWRYLNEAVFDGKLTPPVRFELRRFKGETAGWCQPYCKTKQRRVRIGISTALPNRKTFLEILGHEMVHQWEWEIKQEWDDKKGDHGPNFYGWREALAKRAGLTLTRRYEV